MSTLPTDPPPHPEGENLDTLYAHSALRTVTGVSVPEAARGVYRQRALCTHPLSPVRTLAHPELGVWLSETGGFDPRLRITQPPQEEWPMTRLIPRVRPYKSFPPFPLPAATYAVDYQSLTTATNRAPDAAWAQDTKALFPAGSRVILDFIGNNQQTQWIYSMGRAFWHEPFLQGFDAIVCPEFSTFENDPAPQMLIGERQKQIFLQEGYDMGFTVIPSLAWSTEDSLRRQLDLVGSLYPAVNTVWLDLLGAEVEGNAWTWGRLEALAKHLPVNLPVRWIVCGASSAWAITELHQIFQGAPFHQVSIRPYANAVSRAGTPNEQRERFMRACHRTEALLRGEDLPARQQRPELPPVTEPDHD